MKRSATVRLAADIGGTFTDVVAFDAARGRYTPGKTLSTPARLVDGISRGLAEAASDYAQAGLFLHGSTVAINTLLERTGAKTALLVTEGFRDIYEIGRINRPDKDDAFTLRAGGGFGPPRERDSRKVAEDVRQGYVSPHAARELYGVVVDEKTFALDEAATANRRSAGRS